MLKLLNEDVIENKDSLEVEAFTSAIDKLIHNLWDVIDNINSVIVTFDYEYKEDNLKDIKGILSSVIDDNTINIGMLNKAIDIINSQRSELIDQGENKAEEIISISEE